ncbi:hypothetical protein BHC62_23115 [Pseudomonas sp. 06C 126]|nr:hypothetical protein BHC62_23115 [Pseudomonas sp. 06C 126]
MGLGMEAILCALAAESRLKQGSGPAGKAEKRGMAAESAVASSAAQNVGAGLCGSWLASDSITAV